jgi:hypothetical protein
MPAQPRVVTGFDFLSPAAPQERPWMWASGHYGDIAVRRTATSRRVMRPCRRLPGVGIGSTRPKCAANRVASCAMLRIALAPLPVAGRFLAWPCYRFTNRSVGGAVREEA